MNLIQKTTFISILAISCASTLAIAEEAASTPAAAVNSLSPLVTETMTHVEQAIVEIQKSDFAASYLHLKAARETGAQISSTDEKVKQANMLVIQGQISSKKGDIQQSTDLLTQALTIYKSL